MLDDVPVLGGGDDSPAALAGRAVGVLVALAGVAVALGGGPGPGDSGVVVGAGTAVVGLTAAAWPAIPVVVGRAVADLVAWLLFEVVWRLVAGLVGAILDGI